jgi:bacterioferritin-associated ferredoxin
LYLCLCRAISDRDVAQVAEAGGRTVAQIFKSKGCRPNCGSCVGHLRAALEEAVSGCPAGMAAAD